MVERDTVSGAALTSRGWRRGGAGGTQAHEVHCAYPAGCPKKGKDGKEFACSAGVPGSIPGSGRFPQRRKWQPTPVFLMDNPTDRGAWWATVQFSSVAQSCPTFCDPMNRSTPGLPVHHQLPEFTQTHVHRIGDSIQPSHPLSSPSPPAPNPSQHQSLCQ